MCLIKIFIPTNPFTCSSINVLVIGIGDGTDRAELERIAGDSDKAYTTSFAQLDAVDFVEKLAVKTCAAGTQYFRCK